MYTNKKKVKPVIYIFCCSVSVGNIFTFPNIPCALLCNNPVRFAFAQGVWRNLLWYALQGDLISQSSSPLHEETEKLRLNPE